MKRLKVLFSDMAKSAVTTTPSLLAVAVRPQADEWPWQDQPASAPAAAQTVYFKMQATPTASYDVVQVSRDKRVLSKKHQAIFRADTTRQEACNVLLGYEVHAQQQLGRLPQDATLHDLKEHVAHTKYPCHHIFTIARKDPRILERWFEQSEPQLDLKKTQPRASRKL